MKKYILLSLYITYLTTSVNAQNRNTEWQVGFFAPYISNMGCVVGYAFDLKGLGDNHNAKRQNKQRLQILTQLGYFTQVNITQNFVLNPELVYRWNKSDKRFFLTSSIGVGYLRAFQKQEGVLNLGTGDIEYRFDDLNYFLPTLNIGLGVEPKKLLGFFLKASYGRKLSIKNANAAFVGLSTGLVIRFNAKN